MSSEPADHNRAFRLVRLLLLAVIAAAVTLAFFPLLPGSMVIYRLSMGTAYAGLVFLAAALLIGPLNVLRGVSNPVSTYLRRDIGIVAGVLALAHTIIGLQVHLGDFVQYFFYRTPNGIDGLRHDLFGWANHVGLIAALVMLVLLAISNNLSLRKLGAKRWKSIQRWNYVGAIFVIAHGFLYQVVENRKLAFVACVVIVAAAVTLVQLLGFRRRREQLEHSVPAGAASAE
jgi:sulfoxide reductase heme-binding subunit YedZ